MNQTKTIKRTIKTAIKTEGKAILCPAILMAEIKHIRQKLRNAREQLAPVRFFVLTRLIAIT